MYSLNSNLDYFFTPTELKEQNISSDKRIKIGGMVLEGSVFRNDSNISFTVTDYESFVKVEFKGIVLICFKRAAV
ncbi:MAG: hypothetical protein CM15mP76_01070 [Prochlorococcus sp.]|nr:MAG: hypothetical protein CM15mP76_01070 [Prochlorococcus sp.]